MNNCNEIKLINENGVEKSYGQIPDLWHVAMSIKDASVCDDVTAFPEECAEDILQVWHMAHDLKSVVEKQGKAKLIEPSDDDEAEAARNHIIGALIWNDRNGVYSDDDMRAEGLEPMTLAQATQALINEFMGQS